MAFASADCCSQCDTRIPQCTQCVKAKRTCPGYRNQLDLMFRDESQHVIQKAVGTDRQTTENAAPPLEPAPIPTVAAFDSFSSKPSAPSITKSNNQASSSSAAGDSFFGSGPTGSASAYVEDIDAFIADTDLGPIDDDLVIDDFDDFDIDIDEFIPASTTAQNAAGYLPVEPPFSENVFPLRYVAPPVEQQALSFFHTYYMSGDGKTFRGNFDYLGNLYSQIDRYDPLCIAVDAVSLAGLGQAQHYEPLLGKANKSYVHALQATNAALADPTRATRDSTLAAVQLLGVYETITCMAPSSLDSWCNHVQGASTLLRLRGKKQFKTAVGLRMFMQIQSSIWIACIKAEIDVPAEIFALREYASRYFDTSDPAWMLSAFIGDSVRLRARMGKSEGEHRVQLVREAIDLDRRVREAMEALPAEWRCETYFTEGRSDLVYEGYYHVYGEQWKAQTTNNFRICRLLIMEVIYREAEACVQAKPPLMDVDEFTRIATEVGGGATELVHSYCATVPQQMGYHEQLYERSWKAGGGRPKRASEIASSSSASSPSSTSTSSQETNTSASNSSNPPLTISPLSTQPKPPPDLDWSDIARLDISSPTAANNPKAALSRLFARNRSGTDPSEPRPQYCAASAYILTFPLFLVSEVALSPDRMKLWIARQLDDMGATLGVRQAVVLAELIRMKVKKAEMDRKEEMQREGSRAAEAQAMKDGGMRNRVEIEV